jgi:hypothetical protein
MSAATRLLDAVDRVAWGAYGGSEYYDEREPPSAFRQLVEAHDEASAHAASSAMLFAIGNNHRGTYYPAARAAVPLLVQAAATLDGWPRWSAVDVLTDLMLDFALEDDATDSPEQGALDGAFLEAVQLHTGVACEDVEEALAALQPRD